MKVAELSEFFGISPDERVTIVGKTKSGKTQLAKRMVQEFNSVLILDFKHTIRITGIEITSDTARLKNLGVEFPHIIFRVPHEWEEAQLNELFKWAFIRENTLIYIDEGFSVGTNSSYPKYLKIIAVQGREKNVTLWSLFQRPRGVPKFLVTEAEHIFAFWLNDENDRAYISELAQTDIDWMKIAPKQLPSGKLQNSHMFFHVIVGDSAQGPFRLKEEQQS